MSLRDELLIPFHGAGEAGHDLLAGSAVLLRYARQGLRAGVVLAWRSAWTGESFADRLESLGTAALAGGAVAVAVSGAGAVLVYAAAPFAEAIGGVAVVVWITAAWMVSPPGKAPAPRNDHEKSVGEQHTEPNPQDLPDRMARLVLTAVAEAETAGYKGIHVAEILRQMHAAGIPAFKEVGPLRAWLEASQIPVRRNLKLRGKGNTYGIHIDDLTATLGMPPRQALNTPAQAVPEAPVTPSSGAEQGTPSGRHLTPVPSPSPEVAA